MKIRTRAEIIKSLGVHPGTLDGCVDMAVNKVAIMHAVVNVRALAGDMANPFYTSAAGVESAINAILDCEERLRDIRSGNDD